VVQNTNYVLYAYPAERCILQDIHADEYIYTGMGLYKHGERDCEGINLARDRVQCRVVVNTEINVWGP
jgi:hypothetical protein